MSSVRLNYSLFLKITVLASLYILAFRTDGWTQWTLSGNVIDKVSGKPLPGTNIIIEQTYLTGVSDNNGMFVIRNLKTGWYNLKISYMGYKTIDLKLHLDRDTTMQFDMEVSAILGEEVNIIATRAQSKTPATFATLTTKQIDKVNLGQDMPYILQSTPSVVVTSDAGTGIGYTGINIRGTDLTRINVTINGVPLNDAESQGVWFVDLPDLSSSTDNIQVQRGVGTSTNGAGAFGATINIQTLTLNEDPYAELNLSAGSFNTVKTTFRFGSGLFKKRFSFDGRASYLTSNGYIDRAFSRLQSFYLSGGYFGQRTTLKFNVLSGREKTYQAWEGVPEDSLSTNRTYNPSGEYIDNNGSIAYYDNQTDNYTQTHYQLIFSQEIGKKINLNAALHLTTGNGYYENYKPDQALADYGLSDVIIGNDTITHTTLINRKMMDNIFYGITFSGNYIRNERLKIILGGAWNHYYGEHFGKVIWAEYASDGDNERNWYDNTGLKKDFNIFAKFNFGIIKKLNLFVDVQYRNVYYKMDGILDDLRDIDQVHTFNFFNPKIGVYFDLTEKHDLYCSLGTAHREPSRNNYKDADPDHMPTYETMYDLEIGYNMHLADFTAGLNFYFMNYENQLVLTGEINNVGEAIMTNVPHSYRAGIEMTAGANIFKWLNWNISATLSRNKIKNFTEYVDNYDSAWNFTGQVSQNLGETDLSFSPGILFTNTFTFSPLNNFNIGLTSKYIGKQFIDNTSSNDRMLHPYFLNSLAISYTFKTKFFKNIGFNLMINNLLSEKYESNAWVYRYFFNGNALESNGYFPQALINFLFGISVGI